MATEEDRIGDEANRLYWESNASVAAIADRLDISRRALYGRIRPRPAGTDCPGCGAPMVYRNRMGRTAGEVECPECGREENVATLREPEAEAPVHEGERESDRQAERSTPGGRAEGPGRAPAPETADRASAGAKRRPTGPGPDDADRAERGVLLGAATLAGLVFGVVVTLLVSRR